MPAYLPPEHTALALRAGEMVQHISVKEKQPPLAQLTHVNTCLPTEGIWRGCRAFGEAVGTTYWRKHTTGCLLHQ